MTDVVNPSPDHSTNPFQMATTVMRGGGTEQLIADQQTTYLADDAGLAGTPFNAFVESSSASSLDVTFDTGEGFVGGAFIARDTTTTITLDASTVGQTVYLGYSGESKDTLIIGRAASSKWPSSGRYQRTPIYTFDTDGSGVTASADHRALQRRIEAENARYESDTGRDAPAAVDRANRAAEIGPSAADSVGLSRLARSDESDTIDGIRSYIQAGSPVDGTTGSGEVARWGSTTSDFNLSLQGGFGRVAWSWNAYYDTGPDKWCYIVSDEPAYQITMKSGQLLLRTAPGGTATNAISWVETEMNNVGEQYLPGKLLINNEDATEPTLDRTRIHIAGGAAQERWDDIDDADATYDLGFDLNSPHKSGTFGGQFGFINQHTGVGLTVDDATGELVAHGPNGGTVTLASF